MNRHLHWLRRTSGQAAARLVAAAILLTLAVAAPVVLAPSQHIFGREIVGRHHDPFTVMEQFAGAAVPAPYVQPATDWVGRALATVLSPVASYNVVVLATFPLAAAFAYLFAFEMTRSVLASSIAGLAFAFSPFHVAHAAYHPHIAQVQWIPLFFLAVWRCVHGFTRRRAAFLLVTSALVCASNFYGGFIAAVLTPAVVALFWATRSPDRRGRAWRDVAWTGGILVAVALVGLLIVHARLPAGLDRGDVLRAQRGDLFRYSARWWALFVPPVDHALFGGWARTVWTRYGIGPGLLEQQVYLGFGLTALAAVAGARWIRRRDDEELRAAPAMMAVAMVALLCALSPDRTICGWRLVRPSAALYEWAPMFRAYARFTVVVQLMVAMLAGIGARSLWGTRARAARAAVIGLLALAAFEYTPLPWRWRDVLPTSAHRWLAARHVPAPRVFECSDASEAEQATGWLATFPIVHANELQADCGDPEVGLRLGAAGITHLIVRAADPQWPVLEGRARAGLREVYRSGDSAAFGVVGGSSAAYVSAASGWSPREYEGSRTWRWSGGESTLTVWNPGPAPRSVMVTLELAAFATGRHVHVSLNGEPAGDLLVDVPSSRYSLGPLALLPGASTLTLHALEPGLAPAALDGSKTDRRPLTIALGEWATSEPSAAGTPRTAAGRPESDNE